MIRKTLINVTNAIACYVKSQNSINFIGLRPGLTDNNCTDIIRENDCNVDNKQPMTKLRAKLEKQIFFSLYLGANG